MPPNVSAAFARRRRELLLEPDVDLERQSLSPARSISRAAVKMVPGSFGFSSAVLAATTTFAPSAAARSAIARPIPRLPPL